MTFFATGTLIILISIVPFSYMNHASKFQPDKCERLMGTVSEVLVDYKRRSNKQVGWIVGLKEHEFKVRIRGAHYQALDHEAFGQLIKPNATIEFLVVKSGEYGLFEKINASNGLRDAAGIIINGVEVLSIMKLNQRLSSLYATNLAIGLFLVGIGLLLIYNSIR